MLYTNLFAATVTSVTSGMTTCRRGCGALTRPAVCCYLCVSMPCLAGSSPAKGCPPGGVALVVGVLGLGVVLS